MTALQAHLVLESDSPFRLILYWKRVKVDLEANCIYS
jgi:hypothetical protein